MISTFVVDRNKVRGELDRGAAPHVTRICDQPHTSVKPLSHRCRLVYSVIYNSPIPRTNG
jgi:hypothetical protein